MAQQRRARCDVAHFFDRATHIDVDDMRAFLNIENGGFGHHGRVGSGDLHGDRRSFAFVIEAPRGFDAVPKPGIAGGHFGDGMPCTQPLAQLPVRTVGDTGHRGDKNTIGEGPGADTHGMDFNRQLGLGLTPRCYVRRPCSRCVASGVRKVWLKSMASKPRPQACSTNGLPVANMRGKTSVMAAVDQRSRRRWAVRYRAVVPGRTRCWPARTAGHGPVVRHRAGPD